MLRVVTGLVSDLDLDSVLRRTVEAACEVTGARYGAIGVLDITGHELAAFVTHGVSDLQRKAIGELPRGKGVLGLLISDPRTRRIDDVTGHPASVGFPPGHPPMRSMLGAPIRIDDRVFGILYLTERQDGRPFSAEDERALTTLVAAAAPAVRNAQTFARMHNRARWTAAVGDLTQTLLEGRHESAALARMAKRARELGDASFALVALRTESGALHIDAADAAGTATPGDAGSVASASLGRRLRSRNWQLTLRYRVPLTLMEMPGDDHVGELLTEIHEITGIREPATALVVPITVGEEQIGLIGLAWPTQHAGSAFETMDMLPEFAGRMGLALESGRAQRQRARASLLEDRDRIARDMHDHVIQRLFAAGLALQVVGRRSADPERERIDATIEELNETVLVLREAITGLHRHLPEGGLGPEIEQLVAAAGTASGFVPDLSLEGRLGDLPPDLEFEVLAVVREGLSNMVRHSQALDASVLVRVTDEVLVVIQDDGVGLGDGAERSGLANLAERARAHRGSLAVTNRHPGGTMLRWRAPLR